MAATAIVHAEIVATDITGKPCDMCGETPWLEASAIVLTTGEHAAYLCCDCVQMIRENAEEIG